jgi:Flp pilus assembly secretin CpaC
MRRLSVALIACMSLGATVAGAQTAGSRPTLLAVSSGQAAHITLSGPVRDIVVGDPLVADVSVVNERTLVVLGKKAGATTLLAFDARGQALADRQIVVSAIPDQVVVVQRGAKATVYACGNRCSSLTPDAPAADAPPPADK